MSIQAVAWVIEHCEATLGARCLMFAIANHANERGENCWASVRTLAHEARISRTAAQKNLRRLEEDGVIEVTGTHKKGTQIVRICGMGGQSNLAPDEGGPTSDDEGANLRLVGGQLGDRSQASQVGPNPEPSTEPSTEPGAADAAASIRFCRWLSEQAGESPRSVYSDSELSGAAWLLGHADHAELTAAVEWAFTRTYWAARARSAGKLRRNWADLRVEWQASKRGRGTTPGEREHPASKRIRDRMEGRPA